MAILDDRRMSAGESVHSLTFIKSRVVEVLTPLLSHGFHHFLVPSARVSRKSPQPRQKKSIGLFQRFVDIILLKQLVGQLTHTLYAFLSQLYQLSHVTTLKVKVIAGRDLPKVRVQVVGVD